MNKKFVMSLSVAAFAALSASMFAQMPGAMKQVVGIAEVEDVANVQSRRYTGQVVAQAVVNVTPRVSGEILKLGFNDGDYVKKGQMLYTIEKTQYEAAVKQAEASIAEIKANLEYAQSSYDRNERLYEVNAASKDAMENTKSALGALKAAQAAAEAALVTANDNLKYTTITAAIDGLAGVTKYTEGNYITPSSGPLVTIIQMQPIRVRFSMSTGDFLSGYGSLTALKKDGQVSLKLADGSEYATDGKIEFLNNEANVKTDAIQVYASFPNADMKLIPGSTVTVTLSKKSAAKMPAVPPSAVMHDAQTSFVYVVGEGNKLERREVELGDMTKTHQLIKSGLKTGEKVVYQGTHKVMPGDEIIPAANEEKK
ncbi:MAG: efflux RND transporter periplasmic adaptor subunit [Lentisphaeria bacterium]|nr:efflux RND transporter periplasmic adaptor subunit [Lentisphaeria bacterium]